MSSFALDNKPNRESGLSLIEVIVAMALLAMASFLIYSVILGSFEVNRKLSLESDTLLGLTVAAQAVDRDIAQMYSPVLGDTTPPVDAAPFAFWSAQLRSDGLRRMRFVGTPEKMSFVTAANRRLQRDSREGDLVKVVWEIVRTKDATYALTRHSDINVFDYTDEIPVERENSRLTVIDHLTTAKFQYMKTGKETWDDTWDSEAAYTEDATRFPERIAIEVSYPNPENKEHIVKWRSEFAPMFDLNGRNTVSTGTSSGTNPNGQQSTQSGNNNGTNGGQSSSGSGGNP